MRSQRSKIGHAVLAVLAATAMAAGAWAGRDIPFSQQVQLLRELREVSTIILAIIGAWIAIIYPEELKRQLRATEAIAVDPKRLKNFRMLTLCLFLSAAIVVTILVVQFAAPIVGRIEWVACHASLLRSVSFAFACLFAVGQIWIVLLMLIPINSADADAREVEETQKHLAAGPQGKRGTRKRR